MLARLLHVFGGYAMRQRTLRLLFLSVFLSFLGTSVVFPLRLLYAQAHGATPAEIGLMAAAFLVAPLVSQLPMGWLVDRWGRVPVLMLGLISHAILSALYIAFNTPVELIALRFVEGISVSAFSPAVNSYIADVTPEEHRAEAYGTFAATLNAGMLVGPLIGGVIGQYIGFQAAYAVNCAVEVAAIVLIWGRITEPAVHAARLDEDSASRASVPWRRLISPPLLAAYVAFCCSQIVMGVLSSLWSIWVSDLGGSYSYIGATFTVFALPQILLGAMAGRASDRWGRAPVLFLSGLLVSVIYVSYGFVTSLAAIMALGIVEGIFAVFQQPAAQGLLADASPVEARGRAQGLAGSAGAIGGALSAFAALPLYHASHVLPWLVAGGVMTAGSLIAAVGALMVDRHRRPASLTTGEAAIAR